MFQNQSRRFRRIRNGDAEGVPQFFIGLSERGYAFFRHVVQGDEIARVLIFQLPAACPRRRYDRGPE